MKRKTTAATPLGAKISTALAPLLERWRALSPRERHLSSLAASAVGILLVWAVALAPALRTLQKVRDQRQVLDSQTGQMLALQAEARLLAAQPRISREVALKALQEAVASLGSDAQMQVNGERVVVTLNGVPAARVAAWIGQARTNARVIPSEIRLVRSPARTASPRPGGAATPVPPAAAPASPPRNEDIRWDGTLALSLPVS